MGDENEENLIEKVRNLAARAVQHDQLKQLSAAVYFYHEAAKVMDQLYSLTGKDSYQAHGEKYKKRADELRSVPVNQGVPDQVPGQIQLKRAKSLLLEALDLDEDGRKEEALQLYTEAVETCLEAKKQSNEAAMQEKLEKLAINALERAETLKNGEKPEVSTVNIVRPLGNLNLFDKGELDGKKNGEYTEEERKVLRETSNINGRDYVPFISADLRKVIVDDYFPLGPHNELLCSYSSNKSELWISLLEKAYMKVMGGYDFPGSNSNIDLFALTGWIPERVAIRPEDPTFNPDSVFSRLHDRFHHGDVLATAATGELSDEVAENAGLVSTHAYAVLDIRLVKGEKLFLLKNPWSHLRWRGNWSELDVRHWTQEFQTLLNYNPEDAANFDNGVFWMDYKSLQKYFDVLYLNWNPDLFRNRFHIHQLWRLDAGPVKDTINIGENPQFSLEVRDCANGGAVWLLLSRHILDIADFKDNKEYITLLVYKNNGKRVYYPFDPPPFIDGVRINSPHYLTRMVLQKGESVRRFTLVVSQFEKTDKIYFTVRAFSNQPFTLGKVKNPFKNKKELTGKWEGRTAGGCANNKETWPNNPRFKLVIDTLSQLQIQLKGPRDYQIGFDLLCISASDPSSPIYFKKKSSGVYRPGFVVLSLDILPGTYDLLPSTFRAGEAGAFILTVACSASFDISR